MITQIRKCDGCGKTSDDHMRDGWIVIGDGGFTKYKGRISNGTAAVEIYWREGRDFCSWSCLKVKRT